MSTYIPDTCKRTFCLYHRTVFSFYFDFVLQFFSGLFAPHTHSIELH